MSNTCRCPAYDFPHQATGGWCINPCPACNRVGYGSCCEMQCKDEQEQEPMTMTMSASERNQSLAGAL